MTVTIENKTIGLTLNPASPVTLTIDETPPIVVQVTNGPALNLTVDLPSDITLQMESGQGPSGVYGSSEYSIRIDQVDANTIYRGEAAPGSSESMTVWRIQRITISGSSTTVLWAGGNNSFTNRWTDRLSLSYT